MLRLLMYDISLSSPGGAVLEYDEKKRKVSILALSHVKTTDKDNYATRGAIIEHWAHLFAREHRKRRGPSKYDMIGREKYSGKFGHHSIFSAWAAVDRGIDYLGLDFTEDPIPQSRVKLLVVGKGKAEKEEVAEAVRRITGYTGEFATDDESDAVAIGLAYLIERGMIDNGLPPK